MMDDSLIARSVTTEYVSPGAPLSVPSKSTSEPDKSTAWERLRFINRDIQMMLHLLATGDSLRPGVASPELITVLLTYLGEVDGLRHSGLLDEDPAQASPLTDDIWRCYRATLKRLRLIVPQLEQQLRNDRTCLAQQQNQLGLASIWISAAKLTR
jgi:hypothetical protein